MPDVMGIDDIAFPHLGIYLENVPQSITIFGFQIAFYGIIIGIGMLLGVCLASFVAKKEHLDTELIWDFAIYAIIFSIIGARLYYVAFSWDYYKDNIWNIFNLRQGGLAIYGGVIAGFLTLYFYSRWKKISTYQLGDCAVHGLVLGQIIGRWGNFFNREVFGEYTDSLLAMRLPIDAVRARDISDAHIAGMEALGDVNFIQVHPTFLYEGIGNLMLLIFMMFFHKKKRYHGQMCLIYLGGYGLIRYIVEGIRTDQLLIPGTTIAVSQMLGIALFVFAVILNAVIMLRKKKQTI